MRNMKKTLPTLLVGVLVLLITLVSFFMTTPQSTSADRLGLFFLVLAEVLFFGGLIGVDFLAQKTGTLVRSGGYTVLGLYLLGALVLSLIMICANLESVTLLATFQIILPCAAAILLVLLVTAGGHRAAADQPVQRASAALGALAGRVQLLSADPDCAPLLNQVWEALRYSDTSTALPIEREIEKKVEELEALSTAEDRQEQFCSCCQQLLALLNRRTAELKQLKSGRL